MKKLYAFLAIAAATTAVTAQNAEVIRLKAAPIPGLENKTEFSAAKQRSITKNVNAQKAKSPLKLGIGDLVGGTETWKKLGTGRYTDVLFESVLSSTTYSVEIEESSTEAGKYRLIPYGAGSTLAEYIGQTDTEYMIIHAGDPAKVYMEDFCPFSAFLFSQLVSEDEWTNYNEYGTISDGIITIPSTALVTAEFNDTYTEITGWYYASSQDMVIALPGAKDYTIKLHTFNCPEDAGIELDDATTQVFGIESGADVATIYMGFIPGHYTFTLDDAALIKQYGQGATGGSRFLTYTETTEIGIYTLYAAAFDATGTARAVASDFFLINYDDSDNWEYAGTATYTESMLCATYQEVPAEDLDMLYQVNKENPGMIRLVEPYAYHSGSGGILTPHDTHSHYIYIDATNENAVKVKPSALGIDCGYGSAVIWSPADILSSQGVDDAKIAEQGYFGKKEGNKIHFDDEKILLGERGYMNGKFFTTKEFNVTLKPDSSDGVGSVAIEDNSNAPVEYYNLQGVRVNAPTAGGVYIRRQGTTTNKTLVR